MKRRECCCHHLALLQIQTGAGRAAMSALRGDVSDPSSFEDMRDFLDKLMEGIDFQLDEV